MLKKLLVVPLISTTRDVWREGDFIVWTQLIRQWKDVLVYLPINEAAEIPPEFQLENVVYIRMPEWFTFMANMALMSSGIYELFNVINGQYQVDAILTSKSVVGANLKRLFWHSEQMNIPVFIAELKAADIGKTHDTETQVDLKLRAVTYSECTTFMATEREKNVALGACRRYMSPAMVAQIDDRMKIQSQGMPAKYVHSVAHEVEKFEKPTLLFAARFNSNKQWEKVLDAFETIFRMGHGVEIKALGPNPPSKERAKLYEKCEFLPCMPYADYVQMLTRCHVSCSASIEEGFTFGHAEQVCTGNPTIMPRREWAWSLVNDEKYPFLYTGETEMLAMIKWCLMNLEEAREKMKPYSEYIMKTHDIGVAADEYKRYMGAEIPGTFLEIREWGDRLEQTLAEMTEDFTFEYFLVKAHEMHGMNFGVRFNQFMVGAYRNVHQWLCTKADIMMAKKPSFRRRS